MTKADPAGRTATVIAVLSMVGDVLLLQLLFLVLSVGVVTLFPAAFALQRVLPIAIGQEHAGLARRFWAEFTWALRRFWLLGLGLCALAVAAVTALLFWAATADPVRIIALAALIPLVGAGVGLYIAVLAVLPRVAADTGVRALIRTGSEFLTRRPLAVAGAVIGLATWFLLVLRLPTLIAVGSGLVPALLAHLVGREKRG